MKNFVAAILNILDGHERRKLLLLSLADLLIGVLDVAFLGALLLIINFYTTGKSPAFISAWLPGDNSSLSLICSFFLLFALKNAVGYWIAGAEYSFFYRVASRLSRRNMLHYLRSDYSKFIHVDSSVYTRKISQQPIEFSNYILTNLQQVISQGILVGFTIIAILFYHPGLFLSLFLLLMPPVVLIAYYARKRLKAIRASNKITAEKTLQHLNEALAGYIESNVYGKNDFFTDRYFAYQQHLNNNIATQQKLQGLPSRLIEVFAVMGFLALVVVSRMSIGSGSVDLLNIGVFMAASYKIIPGIVKILNSTGQMKTYEFVLKDLAGSEERRTEDTRNSTEKIQHISLQHIDFKYRYKQLLNDFSLTIEPGDFIGISGPSGLGKTTIVNLLLGFIEPDNGSISINSREIHGDELRQFWGRISYVKQQPFFINDTVVKNITLTDDSYDAEKLAGVIGLCGVNLMLSQYPEGINKIITEDGKNISGGQRQRIALARALYHDFDLLILDEPFSELDGPSERDLLRKLQDYAALGKMIVFITHNRTSLNWCNKVISPDEQYA